MGNNIDDIDLEEIELDELDFNIDNSLPKNKPLGTSKELLREAALGKKIIDAQIEEKKVFMRERQKHMDLMLDTEYYFCVFFKSHAERKEFLERNGLKDDRYIAAETFLQKVLK